IYTIAWAATDDAGNVDGIGSRFFTVQNTGSIHQSTTRGYTNSQKNNRFIPGGNMDVQLAGFSPDLSRSVGVIKGYRQDITPVETLPNDKGELTITIKELERMEIHFSQKASDILKEPSSNSSAVPGFAGYLAVGKQLRPLPIGSTLDVKKGTFSWLPAPGFSGEYKLIFIDKKNHSFLRINIHITPAAK
ncbi:MAG: hypothetical protein GY757_02420, partial [bacterium]|nr:hypothetical protein [bacterium]